MHSFLIPSLKLLYKIFLCAIIISNIQIIDNLIILNQLHADNFVLITGLELFTVFLYREKHLKIKNFHNLYTRNKNIFSLRILIYVIESSILLSSKIFLYTFFFVAWIIKMFVYNMILIIKLMYLMQKIVMLFPKTIWPQWITLPWSILPTLPLQVESLQS